MRNTCALNIPRIPARVQLLVVTNEQRHCDMTENAPLHTPRHPTPGNPNLISGTKHLNPGNTGSQTTPPLEDQAKASTYASSCSAPFRGPKIGLLTGGK